MKVKIDKWKAVAYWQWMIDDDCCTICQGKYEMACPGCQFPGESCPPVLGNCNHKFHLHCLYKWESVKKECPLCRQPWEEAKV